MYSGIKYLHLTSVSPKRDVRAKPSLPCTPQSVLNDRCRRWVSPFGNLSDQSLFAAPQGLSQRTTSFIASQRQGIHRIPLWHLIALIIDVHRSSAPSAEITLAADPVRRTGIDRSKRPVFASNIPENARGQAVRTADNRSRQAGDGLHAALDALTRGIGYVSSSRCQMNPRSPAYQDRKPMSSHESRKPVIPGRDSIARRQTSARPRSNWWSQTGSNRRPHACKARALPTELWPQETQRLPTRQASCEGLSQTQLATWLTKWWAWDDLNVRPHPYQGCALTN